MTPRVPRTLLFQLFRAEPNPAARVGKVPRRCGAYADLASDLWNMYPQMLARDFARFVAVALRGKPEPLEQLTLASGASGPPPGAPGEALRIQQRHHFELSVRYCQEVLGLGTTSTPATAGDANA